MLLRSGVATSTSYTPTAAGAVYWVAYYLGDSNYTAVTSNPADEPVLITSATPNWDIWTGAGGNNDWSNASNWVDSTGNIHQAPTSTSDVWFTGSASSAIVDAPFTINSLTLDGSWRGALTVNSTLTVNTDTYNAAYLQVTSGGNLTLDGPVTNQGEVYVDGNSSQMTVASTLTYTQTASNAYTAINGTMTASGGVDINGGLLDGTGTIDAPVNIGAGGFLLPGFFNAGTLIIAGNLTFNAGAEFDVIVNGTTAGSTYSQLLVNGSNTISLNGATVGVSQNATYTPNSSNQLTVISAVSSTVSGQFATLVLNISNGNFAVSHITYASDSPTAVVLDDPVPVQDGTTLTIHLPPPAPPPTHHPKPPNPPPPPVKVHPAPVLLPLVPVLQQEIATLARYLVEAGVKPPPLHIAGETIPLPSLAAILGKLSDYTGSRGSDDLARCCAAPTTEPSATCRSSRLLRRSMRSLD